MKNYYEIRGGITEIYLGENGLKAIVDTSILEKILSVGNVTWGYFSPSGNARVTYVQTGIDGKPETLHRFLMDFPQDMVVDHINHDTMDNRLCNLQLLSNKENLAKRNKVDLDWHKIVRKELKTKKKILYYEPVDLSKLPAKKTFHKKKKSIKQKEILTEEVKVVPKKKMITFEKEEIVWDEKRKRFEPVYKISI